MPNYPSLARDALAANERTDSEAQTIEALFRSLQRRLGTFLVQMVGNRALVEDLLQESFHDAFRARRSLATIENPEAWLFGIAHNRALAALRRRRRFGSALERLDRSDTRTLP